MRRLNDAFAEAIDEAGYDNVYRGVYPIKVNQLHEVVEEVLDAGKPFGHRPRVRVQGGADRRAAAPG